MPWVVGMWLEYTLRCQPSLSSATFWVLRVPLNGGQTHAGFGTPKMCPDAKIIYVDVFPRPNSVSPECPGGEGGRVLPYKRLTGKWRWMVRIFTTAIMDKSLGTLLRFWGVFQYTQSNPSAYPTNNVGRVYPEFLPSFSFVYGEGGGGGGERNPKKFRKGCTVLRGNREMTEKYEYWSTFPRTLSGIVDWLWWGRIFNRVTRIGSHIFRFLG